MTDSTLRKLTAPPIPRAVRPGGIGPHAYQRDRHSGAGNCWCGRHEAHALHREHSVTGTPPG